MTYVDVLLLIQQMEEIILNQDLRSVITNKRRYLRGLDNPESAWTEDLEPGSSEKRYTRGGIVYFWKRQELPPGV